MMRMVRVSVCPEEYSHINSLFFRHRRRLAELAATVMAVMILFAIVNVSVFLKLGGLTPWADISDDHGVLLTSTGWGRVLGQP